MHRSFLSQKLLGNITGSLLLLVALNAFGGGYYGMAGADNVPVEWLNGSPFRNYFIPSVILFVFVGGSSLAAAIMVFKSHRYSRNAAFISVFIVFCWLIVQMIIIGYVSWMQPATAITAFLIFLLARKLVYGQITYRKYPEP